MSGATAYTFKDFTDGITVTNADLGDTFALNSFAVDHADDDVTITYRLATGTSDSASITTSGSTLQQVVVDAIETLRHQLRFFCYLYCQFGCGSGHNHQH